MPTDLCVNIHTLYIKHVCYYVCGYRYGAHTHTDNFWYSEQLQTTSISSPYYRWGNWGSRGLRRVFRVTFIISLSPGRFPCCHCWVTTDAQLLSPQTCLDWKIRWQAVWWAEEWKNVDFKFWPPPSDRKQATQLSWAPQDCWEDQLPECSASLRGWLQRGITALSMKFLFFLITYLAVLGLNCSTQNLHCIMQDLSRQGTDFLAVAHGLQSS